MKIQNSTPVTGKTTQTTKRSSTSGLFGQLLDAESHQTDQSTTDQPHDHGTQTTETRAPMQEAWHTLEESVTLLDEAMQCIESGDSPPQKLIQDIEQLRALLRNQVASGGSAIELKQADTLLAVEAERIRAMQS
ncbi:MAG: hypothetical protein Q9M17_10565 [Mariprofundus sp.]|nr:hypothetical protein [Mariprofundus sp.]